MAAGEKAGPEKLKKAESLNISIINENVFYQMIGMETYQEEGTLF